VSLLGLKVKERATARFQSELTSNSPEALREDTPRKINMEPDKTPLEDENYLPNRF